MRMVCIPNCDKIVPGMLLAAMRVNIPTIFVSGGAMKAGMTPEGETIDLISVFEGVGAYSAGKIDEKRLTTLERFACPSCGSCSGMFTANSMNCLMEAIGLALPFNGSALAKTPEREALARQAATQIMTLIERDLKPRDIVTPEAIDDAFALDMAMGGSSNTVLHTLALANEAGVEYPLERINTVADKVPHICKVSPAGKWHMEDVHRAGGIPAILNEIQWGTGMLHFDRLTVSGKTLGESIQGCEIKDEEVIRRYENAHSKRGGLAILFGNLAPKGAVVKVGGVSEAMMKFEGPAVIFESQEDAMAGILGGKVKAGDCVVVRYEGPKGGPGMQEMLIAHFSHHGHGTGRQGRFDHGRPFQRRDARGLHWSRFPGSGGARSDRRAAARGCGRDRSNGAHAGRPFERGGDPEASERAASVPIQDDLQVAEALFLFCDQRRYRCGVIYGRWTVDRRRSVVNGPKSKGDSMKKTGAEIVWECLVREGVDVVFGYPGGANMPIYDAMLSYPVHHVLVRHEQGGAHMADGYARASGKVGVAMATSGPGATNLVTGIATAMMDSVPVVFITGQVAAHLIGGDAFQETDVTGITLPITKHNYLVTRADQIAETIREAFYIARSGRPGPVLIDICKNAQVESCEFVYPEEVKLPGYQPVTRSPEGLAR